MMSRQEDTSFIINMPCQVDENDNDATTKTDTNSENTTDSSEMQALLHVEESNSSPPERDTVLVDNFVVKTVSPRLPETVMENVDETTGCLKESLKRADSRESCASMNKFMCRICHCEEATVTKLLIAPCNCSGTLRYVHQTCLQKWLKISGTRKCELCNQVYQVRTKLNPVNKLKSIEMTRKEKKILFLTNLLYTIGIVCNFWSELNFLKLITELVRTGNLNWKFYMILFLCVTTLLCIIWLIVLIGQVWMNLLRKFIRNNQSVVIISR